MSDFFSHLTARSFDLAGGVEWVRPRLPSLFEDGNYSTAPAPQESSRKIGDGPKAPGDRKAVPSAGLDEDREKDGLSPPAVPAQQPQAIGAPTPSLNRPLGAEERGTTEVRATPGKPTRLESLTSPAGPSETSIAECKIEPARVPRHEIGPVRESNERSDPGAARLTIARRFGDLKVWEDHPAGVALDLPNSGEDARERLSILEKADEARRTEEVSAADGHAAEHAVRVAERAPVVPRVERAVRRRVGLTAPSMSMEGPVEQRPSVRITIGRVEVRAVMPQRPAAPKEKVGPALSLEAYLKQGREGLR